MSDGIESGLLAELQQAETWSNEWLGIVERIVRCTSLVNPDAQPAMLSVLAMVKRLQ